MRYDKFEDLLGKVLRSVEVRHLDRGDQIVFRCKSGENYVLYHQQDCCECVYIKDIDGVLGDLVGSKLTMAELVTRRGTEEYGDTNTWSFYKLACLNGYVTISWYGSSNGYYSETVQFEKEMNVQ